MTIINPTDALPPAYDGFGQAPSPSLDLQLTAQPTTGELLVSLVPPSAPVPQGEKQAGKRAPVDLCLVLDVSGSMDAEAPAPGQQEDETTGLSVLDVVKHATRTILESLDDDDRVSIVTFSSNAKVVTPLTFMTKDNKADTWKKVDSLVTEGSTNIWDGLKTGLNILTGRETPAPAAKTIFGRRAGPSTPPKPSPSITSTASSSKRSSGFLASLGIGKKRQSNPPAYIEKQPEAEPAPPSPETPPAPISDKKAAEPEKDESVPRLHALFLLTDGQPNVEPPRGHLPSLESYLDAIPANTPRPSIHTFGFGYGLDSSLLDALAHRGGGMYGFMPDSGMVGTVFVHAVANLVCTWAESCEVSVEVEPEAANSVEVLGAFSEVKASWGAKIQVGDILYGQSRDVVVRLPSSCFGPGATSRATVTVHYRPHSQTADSKPLSVTASVNPNIETEDSVDLRHAVFRLSFIRTVKDLFASVIRPGVLSDDAKNACRSSLEKIQADPALTTHTPSVALRTDIASQVLLALEDEHWSRWGTHYLPSLARSHLRQQCANFKDPGLQVYGAASPLFPVVRDALSEKFEALPPPTPSLKDRYTNAVGGAMAYGLPGSSSSFSGRKYSAVTSMAAYYSSAGPCFAGNCDIMLGNGSLLRVDQLRGGMQVRTPNGPRTVIGLLRTACAGGVTDLISLGGLLVTPWHPILHNGVWVFPASIALASRRPCEAVYSILLERDTNPDTHAVCVGGVWCVTLGHGSIEGVRKHEFLGDWDTVSKSMKEMREHQGQPGVIACAGVVRDPKTRTICGFIWGEDETVPAEVEWRELAKGSAAIAVC